MPFTIEEDSTSDSTGYFASNCQPKAFSLKKETARSKKLQRTVRVPVGLAGFEPTTSCTPSKRASQAALQPVPLTLCTGLPLFD